MRICEMKERREGGGSREGWEARAEAARKRKARREHVCTLARRMQSSAQEEAARKSLRAREADGRMGKAI